jgi:two-component system cell cycle response regulator DivK
MSERGAAKVVLLVEDNHDNRVIYGMMLEHAGYQVIEAVDGEEGVDRAREHHPALILMDISIPKIDGYTATRMLKTDASTADIPIIALTAHALAGEEQRARAAGCDGYLSKPVEPKRVLEEVRRFIGPAEG